MRMESAYSPAQIAMWEEHICLPSQYRQSSSPKLNLAYLTALHVHQIAACPYENLTLHYSSKRIPSLNPQDLFQKIVTNKRGRGGYCMELSIFFCEILKGLGFVVYKAGVRVRPRIGGVPTGGYMGWVHIVNILTLPNSQKYMVDVGFGGDGATHPLPMTPGVVTQNLGAQHVRLLHQPIEQFSNQSEKVWIYQYRNSFEDLGEEGWNSFYSFPEIEFLPHDYEIMNYYTSTHKEEGSLNFQTQCVLIIRFLRGLPLNVQGDGTEPEQKIVGKLMLVDGVVKKNDGGKTSVVTICKTEEERVRVLKEIFDISLIKEEIDAVKGRNVELI